MIKNFVEAWDANKDKLQEYFRTHQMSEYGDYKSLVKLLFECVVDPYLSSIGLRTHNTNWITIIDDGDYQGTQIFAIPLDVYQPCYEDYVFTYQYYGSCSGCDTLLAIRGYSDGLPDENQVSEYMTLCLHLLQRCKYPFADVEQC